MESKRCEVCGYFLAKTVADGCVPGNCSYRPHEGTAEYYRIQKRRAELKAREYINCQNPNHYLTDGGPSPHEIGASCMGSADDPRNLTEPGGDDGDESADDENI